MSMLQLRVYRSEDGINAICRRQMSTRRGTPLGDKSAAQAQSGTGGPFDERKAFNLCPKKKPAHVDAISSFGACALGQRVLSAGRLKRLELGWSAPQAGQ